MSIAIYRKYRPKTFSEVTGQPHIKVTLQNEIATNKVGHAFLFCGPRGTGKTTIARLLAKSVNCLDLKDNGEPCNVCANCQEFIDGRALDIIEIDAASHTGVENVRENIIHNTRFTPTKSKFKIFIIDEVHMLSGAAFNALLKTLEEPPSYIIFILATTEAHKVPATIISRCQRFDFKKIVPAELTDRLRWIVAQEGISVDEKVLKQIARLSGGCVRDAESLLEQVLSLGLKSISYEDAQIVLPRANFELLKELFGVIAGKKTAEGIQLANKLINEGVDINQFTDQFIDFVRKILIYKITADLAELSREFDETTVAEVVEQTKTMSEQQLVAIIEKFLSTRETFKQNFLPQLALEVAVVELTVRPSVVSGQWPVGSGSSGGHEPQTTPHNPLTANPQPAFAEASAGRPANPQPAQTSEPVNPSTSQPVNQSTSQPTSIALPQMSAPDMEKIMSVWTQFGEAVKAENYSLFMSLSMCKPVGFENGTLFLGFSFELQRSRAATPQNRLLLSEIMTKIFGDKITVECVLNQKTEQTTAAAPVSTVAPQPEKKAAPSSVEEVANMFGGTVI